ncbi:MAG: hypothetical protein ACLU9R_04030 [Faecalibacterium sp.]
MIHCGDPISYSFHRNKLLAAALLLLWQNPLSRRKGELWAQN